MSTFTYLKSFFKDKDVASVTPSSKKCVGPVCRPIDFDRDLHIFEYAAGAGVLSEYLREQMTPDSRLYLFETNWQFFDKLLEITDSRVESFNQSVEKVTELLPEDVIGDVDFIISGIPFSFLDDDEKDSILNQS